MNKDLVFFVPYHTGYAHIELILAYTSFTNVHLFVYKWNPARQLIDNYFSRSNHVKVHEFSLDTILTELLKQEEQQRHVVVLLTASINYTLGQLQFRFFSTIQKQASVILDVYSTGHCMYGCQSCAHSNSHRIPITFTNYIRTKDLSANKFDRNIDVIICPSFSSKEAPYSLLSNKSIVEQIMAFQFPHIIKLHPLTYTMPYGENPIFSLSELEKEHVNLLSTSPNILSSDDTNTLKLIEHARVLICDLDSSIPFEALYFRDGKQILVYRAMENRQPSDDRLAYFHTFDSAEQLKNLLDQYFTGNLRCKTKDSHAFFLEKYDEPDGNEIEKLASKRQWVGNHSGNVQYLNIELIKKELQDEFKPPLSQMALYALGEHTSEQIHQLSYNDIQEVFGVLFDNVLQI